MTTDFDPLPPADADRLCGVEIEFAGLDERMVAGIIHDRLGGTVRASAAHLVTVEGSDLGDIGVELDTALRKIDRFPLRDEGLDLLRGVIPVEIVTAPLTAAQMPVLNGLVGALRDAGAQGSRSGLLLGFGVHLNPARPADDPGHPGRIAQAYALLEPRLRAPRRVDATRRLLPFVDPWPPGFVRALLAAPAPDTGALRALYARFTQSRNHGLDLLPLLKDDDPAGFAAGFPDAGDVAPRPAYHFRLPDCRIDEAGWSLVQPWRDWLVVERYARDPARLEARRRAFLADEAATGADRDGAPA